MDYRKYLNYNLYRQNGNYTQASLMSPIPRAGQSVEYQNFDTFSQNNENIKYQNSVELPVENRLVSYPF